jgi:hypothetical protein
MAQLQRVCLTQIASGWVAACFGSQYRARKIGSTSSATIDCWDSRVSKFSEIVIGFLSRRADEGMRYDSRSSISAFLAEVPAHGV